MKAILLLLTVAFGSYFTLVNAERVVSMKNQIAAALPAAPSKAAPTDDDKGAPVPAIPTQSVKSATDALSQYGEPQRRETMPDGRIVWYYPYYYIYVQNNMVIGSGPIRSQAVPTQNAPTNGQRVWNNNNATVVMNQSGTGPATTGVGWKANTTSLGTVSLNGNGPTRPVGSSVGPVYVPRSGGSSVRSSQGAGMYRSGSVTTGVSTGTSQWQH
jgi:hypothetical protein